jgi:hypothetical protein
LPVAGGPAAFGDRRPSIVVPTRLWGRPKAGPVAAAPPAVIIASPIAYSDYTVEHQINMQLNQIMFKFYMLSMHNSLDILE